MTKDKDSSEKDSSNTKNTQEELTPKEKALFDTLDNINKMYGAGTVISVGDKPLPGVRTISTGSFSLDHALGGGVPRGRIIEIFGPEGSGKTSIALHVIANAQKEGGVAAFIDAENALDPAYAKRLGVSFSRKQLVFSQPNSGEQALNIVEKLLTSRAVDVIVVDSVAALVPESELAGEVGDQKVGAVSRLMSQGLRRLTISLKNSPTVLIFINQLREKIGVIYGNPEVTPGGKSLKFYSSVRIDVRKKKNIEVNDKFVGHSIHTKVVKNKIAAPFAEADFDMYFDSGIDYVGSLLSVAEQAKVITRKAAYYYYGDITLGNGKEQASRYLRENLEVLEKIQHQILNVDYNE